MNTTITFTTETGEAIRLYKMLKAFGIEQIEMNEEEIVKLSESQKKEIAQRIELAQQEQVKTMEEMHQMTQKWRKI